MVHVFKGRLFLTLSFVAVFSAHASNCLSKIFALKIVTTAGLSADGRVAQALTRFAEKTESAKLLEEAYAEARRKETQGENFVSALTRALHFDVVPRSYDSKIPKDGPLLFSGNHPFGLADGIAAYEFLERNRPGEVMGMATTAISEFMPEFAKHMALIDNNVYDLASTDPKIKSLRDAQAKNNARESLRALRWLQSGKVLCFFPAGLTSRRLSIFNAQAVDRPWKRGLAFFSRATQSPVMFMHTEGSNTRLSDAFAWLGEDIPLLARPWETRLRSEQGFEVRVGDPIYPDQIPEGLNDSLRTGYLYNLYTEFAGTFY